MQDTTRQTLAGSAARKPYIVCKGCNGWEYQPGDGHPYGWYTLSVSVPAELSRDGRAYAWARNWCSARCLAASAADIETAEMLARMAYEADPPRDPGGRP